MKTGAALKPLSFQNGQVFPFFAFVKGDNFEYVQEKEEEEKRLGRELHTQTSPSGQVIPSSSPNLPSAHLTSNIQVPLTMIGGSGLKKMQDGLNGHQVIRNRVQAMHGWRLTRAIKAKNPIPPGSLQRHSM